MCLVLLSCAGPDSLHLYALCLLFLPRWICIHLYFSMYYSITELTNKGVCFVRLSVRPNVKHKHPSRQNRKPHTSQRFCCCLAEVMFLFLESLSLNIFIGDFFTLSYFLANTRNHGLFCHLLYSVKILFKMLKSTG